MATLATRPATETKEIFERKLQSFPTYPDCMRKLHAVGITFEILVDCERNSVRTEINGIPHMTILFDDYDSLEHYAYATIRTLWLTYQIVHDIKLEQGR